MPPFLKKKVAGLPLGVWLIIVAGGVGIGLYLRSRREDAEIEGEEEQPDDYYGTEDYYQTDGSYDTVPIQALPSEDYGAFPITGGGPPSVNGDLALRLTPDTLRIKLIERKKRKKRNRKQDKDDLRGRDEGRPTVRDRNRRGNRVRNRRR